MKIINENKKAKYDYFLEEYYEAGIVLTGNEVKSIVKGDINLRDSFCFFSKGELWLKNCNITPYQGSSFASMQFRDRKLLLHKREINKLVGKINQKGLTLVPVKVYQKDNKIKIEIALARGKKQYDKRQSIKERDLSRLVKRQDF